MVYSQPDLGQLPAELRSLAGRCLAKVPGERPTAAELLAEVPALQPAAGWLSDAGVSAFASYAMPSPARMAPAPSAAVQAGTPAKSAAARISRDRGGRRRLRRSLAVAGVAAVVVAAVAVGFTLTGAAAHPHDAGQPRAAVGASSSAGSTAPASPVTSPAAPGTPSPVFPANVIPAGAWVYFDVHYAHPGNDAQGFGYNGLNGTRRVSGSYPFASPNRGIVGARSVAYPLDLECGTGKQHKADIEAWIYDAAGASSQPAVINMSCSA